MKLTNHKQDNSYNIDTYVMRGTIEMTELELKKVFNFLTKQYIKAIEKCDTYIRDSLSSLKNKKYTQRDINLFSIGVCATKLVAKKYHLKGYKNQNYGIKII